MKYILTILTLCSLASCATSKPKPHTFIVTPYHIYTNDVAGVKPIEIF